MGWVREWAVTIETDDRRSLPGRGATRQVTVGSVPDLKRLVLALRADAAIRSCRSTSGCGCGTGSTRHQPDRPNQTIRAAERPITKSRHLTRATGGETGRNTLRQQRQSRSQDQQPFTRPIIAGIRLSLNPNMAARRADNLGHADAT